MSYTKVLDVKHLRSLIEGGNNDFFIRLCGGFRSSKRICLDENENFEVINEIDGSEDVFTESELFDRAKTNIGFALNHGALYAYD